jgi:hypothetical protein
MYHHRSDQDQRVTTNRDCEGTEKEKMRREREKKEIRKKGMSIS